MAYRKKKAFIFFVFIMFACTSTEPLEDNPLDPDGGEYEVPSVVIVTDIDPWQTITNETFSFFLEGNELVVEYRIRLDNMDWTEWTNDNEFTVDYLDEGQHTIHAQSRYISATESEIVSFNFNVDAVTGPAIMFNPRRQYANEGDQITFTINAEEVNGLAGIEFILGFDPGQISVVTFRWHIFSQASDLIFIHQLILKIPSRYHGRDKTRLLFWYRGIAVIEILVLQSEY